MRSGRKRNTGETWKNRHDYWRAKGSWDDAPSDLAPGSKIRAGPLGPHYPECPPASQSWRSEQSKGKEKKDGLSDAGQQVKGGARAYFEGNVVVSDADLQFLFADDVFLWPVRVIFPLERSKTASERSCPREKKIGGEGEESGFKEEEVVVVHKCLLDDLALLDDALEFFHDERADPH